ncbi:unknown [Prevotella sp. CAG:1058]|nr:unknown [Prevotella sp. CAG:1058]
MLRTVTASFLMLPGSMTSLCISAVNSGFVRLFMALSISCIRCHEPQRFITFSIYPAFSLAVTSSALAIMLYLSIATSAHADRSPYTLMSESSDFTYLEPASFLRYISPLFLASCLTMSRAVSNVAVRLPVLA